MIIFHNPGLIEPNAFRLSGASVKQEGSFGRFGTGLKYAVATILRTEGMITVHSGDRTFRFELETSVLKTVCFSEVVLVEDALDQQGQPIPGAAVRTPLGFTVDLGKDWEPWMAVRELGCNARDEDGDWNVVHNDDVAGWTFGAKDGPEETVFLIDWPKVEETWEATLAQTFAPAAEVLLEEAGVRVLPGPSDYLYHRGVRVWKLPKPSTFTYDVTAPVELTEDRTVKYSFCVVANVRNMILATTDRSIIAAAVSASKETWEGGFDWTGQQWSPHDPGHDWVEEVATLREVKASLSKSATDVFLAHSAIKTATRYAGGSYEAKTGTFGEAADELSELGIDVTEVNVFVIDELPGEAHSTIRGGSVYATKALIEDGSRLQIAKEMLTRYLEVKSGGDHDTLLRLVVPLLLDQSYDLKREREVTEAREAGLRPTVVEAFMGMHPVLPKPDVVFPETVAELVDDVPF